MKKFKKILWIMVVGFLVILAIFIYWKFYFTYSEGSRAGLLQKFSYKGNVIKTYEGELIMSSIESTKSATIASEKFYFSVAEKTIADQLMQLEGVYVILQYKEKHGILFWRGETRYIVDGISTRDSGPAK